MAAQEDRLALVDVSDLIRVGEPLPFKVLDELGRLLLNEGQVIFGKHQMEVLIERGAWVHRKLVEQRRALETGAVAVAPAVVRTLTLFDRWERACWNLDLVLRRTLKGLAGAADWSTLVADLVALVDRDVDIATFLAVHQDDRRFALYPLSHSLRAALLSLLAARQAGWLPERQRSVVGAALAMNVAILDVQAHMAEQNEPPTQRQLGQIRAHPLQGEQLLRAAGVTDATWLRTVAEHHERVDGGGYPRGSTEVCDEARVLRMADVYMAKITPRAMRAGLAPMMASRQLFQQEPGSSLAMALIKSIGVHPPGCLVQLASGEVAVVTHRGAGHLSPMVCTLSDRKGKPTINSQALDSADPAHAITGPCADPSAFARVLPERVYGLV